MKVTCIGGRDLDEGLTAQWACLQQANPALESPYFCPEFTQVVARVRADVEVAVVEDGGRIAAFFPYQRNGLVAGPVGGILSDFQGVIATPGCVLDYRNLIKKCGLGVWDFDHLHDPEGRLRGYCRVFEPSPRIDLSKGYTGYLREQQATGSDLIKKAGNLARRIEREIGPLRFVNHTEDVAVLDKVLGWKSQQYLESGLPDLFQLDWFREIVIGIHQIGSPRLTGVLSALYAGDRLVAGHMGMKSQRVWHYWFPAYDPEYAKYSPGILLLLKLAEFAASEGVTTIDLGKGMSQYKQRLMNASVPVGSGSVELPSWLSLKRRTIRSLRSAVAASPIAGPARRLVRWVRSRSEISRN